MRKGGASHALRISKNYSIKVDEPKEDFVEELTVEASEECVPRSSLDRDSDEQNEEPSEEAEEESEEELTEEAEEESEEELTEEAEVEPDEEPTEEAEEDPDEELVEEVEEESEEKPTEEAEEEPDEEPTEEAEEDPDEELVEEVEEESEEEPTEEAEEEPDDEPTEEAEEDPDEEPIEEVEEESEEEPTEEAEEEPDDKPTQEANEEAEEELTEETEEEELEEEITEESSEYVCQSLLVEDLRENSVSKPSSKIHVDGDEHPSKSVLTNSNEKKRSVDATSESSPLQTFQSRKKCRQEKSSKAGSGSGSAFEELGTNSVVSKAGACEQKESTGSSGKRRRSRWETQPGDNEMCEGDRKSKRRKTRWDVDDSQLKMLGPIQLANFMKEFLDSNMDSEIQKLKARLIKINSKLNSSELNDDRSPPQLVNKRKRLSEERQRIISRLIQKNPIFRAPSDYKPPNHTKKLYIPLKEYPEFNFIGLILGPRGNTQKRMENKTGAKIYLRGKGFRKTSKISDPSDNEDLHVLIEAGNQKSLDAAVQMVEKLLNPFNQEMKEHKVEQLKELAKLKGTYRNENICILCGGEGHSHYACPSSQSTFNFGVSCVTCGGYNHPTTTCPLTASSPAANTLGGSSVGSTPNSNKEINDAKLYVGYLPQAVDDNRLSELFSPFGKVTEVKVIKDRTTGLSKGYGFLTFETSTDAASAVMHMNGFKLNGKMLVVRVAGRPPASGFSVLSHPHMYPGPPVIVVPGQTYFPPPSIYIEHGCLHPGAFGFSTPSSISSLPGPMSVTSFNSSYKSSDQIKFCTPSSLPQFPGDPDYPCSQFQSYFDTPATKPSPSSLAYFPGDPDYPGSQFQTYSESYHFHRHI